MHAGTTIRVDDDVDARAATGQRIARVLVPRRGSDTHSPEGVHGLGQGLAAYAAQLPGDHARLPVTLSGRGQVRELTAADASRTGLGPDGLDAVGRRLDDLDGIRPRELFLDGTHPRMDDLAGCRVSHEDDTPALVTGDARAAVGGLTNRQLEYLADPLPGLHGCRTASRGGTPTGGAEAHAFSSKVLSPGAVPGCSVRALKSSEDGATRKNGSLTR